MSATFMEEGAIYLERSQQTSDCNCFPCQKHKSSAEALTAVSCHGERSSTGKQRNIYPYHIFCSSSVPNLSIILKTLYIIILNNSTKKQQY